MPILASTMLIHRSGFNVNNKADWAIPSRGAKKHRPAKAVKVGIDLTPFFSKDSGGLLLPLPEKVPFFCTFNLFVGGGDLKFSNTNCWQIPNPSHVFGVGGVGAGAGVVDVAAAGAGVVDVAAAGAGAVDVAAAGAGAGAGAGGAGSVAGAVSVDGAGAAAAAAAGAGAGADAGATQTMAVAMAVAVRGAEVK